MIYRFAVISLLLLATSPMLITRDEDWNNQSPPPKLVHTVPPFFDTKITLIMASGFSRSAIPGFADVDVEISNDGKVLSGRFVGGHPLLMASTKAAISQWKFEPIAEGAETRKVQLRFFYNEGASVKISPYEITLDVKYECPSKDDVEKFEVSQSFKLTKNQCEVHKRSLGVETVKIIYGMMGYRKGFWKAHEKDFPHDNFYIGGGCVIVNRQYGKCEIPAPQFGEVSYCQKCREASANWERQHKHAKFV